MNWYCLEKRQSIFFSHQTLIMTRAIAAADPNCFIILTKIYLRSKKRKENQLMIGKSRVNDILDYVLEKKTHLTENEWNIFFVKNSFQILTIFDIGVYRGVYVIYLCCFIGHNTKREFFALSRQNHNNFADTYYVYNSQSQIRFTLHMILAHVLVAIDYYAKCPNLKKPDSLSSTYICSNATHYFKILKKVFAKSLKNHFFSTLKKCTFFQHSSTVAEKTWID